VFQNVVDLSVGRIRKLVLLDAMWRLVSSSVLTDAVMLMGTPMAVARDECEYLYLFPERVEDVE
jgi:hypothetical protein